MSSTCSCTENCRLKGGLFHKCFHKIPDYVRIKIIRNFLAIFCIISLEVSDFKNLNLALYPRLRGCLYWWSGNGTFAGTRRLNGISPRMHISQIYQVPFVWKKCFSSRPSKAGSGRFVQPCRISPKTGQIYCVNTSSRFAGTTLC